MIVLLNAEAILFECMMLIRERVSTTLGVPSTWVRVKIAAGEAGRLFPEVSFQIPDEIPEDYRRARLFTDSRDSNRETLGAIVRHGMRAFEERCAGAGC